VEAVAVLVILFLLLISLAIMAPMVIFGIRAVRNYNLIKETPTSMSVDVEEGLTEVKGTISPVPGGDLVSPIGRVPCVRYEALIQERVSSGKHSRWVTRYSDARGESFLVTDASGLTKVDAKGADLKMKRTYSEVTSGLSGMSDRAGEVLDRHHLEKKGPFGFLHRTYRIIEKALPIGSPVYVLGSAKEVRMEASLKDDPRVNPYTIGKEKVLVVSVEGEEKAASSYLIKGVLLILGGLTIGGFGVFLALTVLVNVI